MNAKEKVIYHVLSKSPVLGEKVNKGERHRETAEQKVRDGQVDDENVSGG